MGIENPPTLRRDPRDAIETMRPGRDSSTRPVALPTHEIGIAPYRPDGANPMNRLSSRFDSLSAAIVRSIVHILHKIPKIYYIKYLVSHSNGKEKM